MLTAQQKQYSVQGTAACRLATTTQNGSKAAEDVEVFFGVMRMDRMKNESVRGTANNRCSGDKCR